MTKRLFSSAGLIVLAAVVLIGVMLVNSLFKNLRVDLTEDNLYTLSDGTRNMLTNLQEPVTLTFYFTNKASEDLPFWRTYAKRVRELLEEYEELANGKLTLNVIDPEPFSEEEDQASEAGLQAVPVNLGGTELYFGLVAKGQAKESAEESITFFQPDRENFLEYDISKVIFAASQTKKPKVALVAGLQVDGGYNMATRQPTDPWMAVSQLDQLFEVERLEDDTVEISDDFDLLVVIHPKELSDDMQFAIDQYVLRGGNTLIFVDPLAGQDTGGGMMMAMGPKSSNLEKLFKAWGVTMDSKKVVADSGYALSISQGSGKRPVRHLGILGLKQQAFNTEEVVMVELEQINMATAGAIKAIEGASTKMMPLIQSSTEAMLMDASKLAMMSDPKKLYDDFKPTGERYALAARIQGPAKTAFPDGRPEKKAEPADEKSAPAATTESPLDNSESADTEAVMEETGEEDTVEQTPPPVGSEQVKPESTEAAEVIDEENTTTVENAAASSVTAEASEQEEPKKPLLAPVSESKQDINVVVVADTDMLADMLWVSVRTFFGQRIAQPFANNGAFFINAVDNMVGNADLISIRSRGQFSRPFTVVDEIERKAEDKFRVKEQELLQKLNETESKLAELQQQKQGDDKLSLSPEQQKEIEQFQKDKLAIRKELRDVQHKLGQDIEALGENIKLLNIFLLPLLLTILLVISRTVVNKRQYAMA
ncbi:Gldg family protein [Endozoicomonas sp. SM1973]|uniref:Gldg family protein n=1 Tax=Spartinivicinus marinus TaxID=2994442 RepID=A0A853IDG2_9GAMM|nr:Gldg family protein [Spartinivicinus marinus]MCX4028558.1 Gldg family protein [Spartinivicinus marinus]NYZ67225.1 Gldg family protein [Spartinivicinus marinus]